MLLKQGSRRITELFAAVLVSFFFSQFSLTILLFTVPLYTLYFTRGLRDLLIGAALVVSFLLLFSLWKIRSVADTDLKKALIIVEMIIPVILMLGMFFVIDVFPVISGLRRLYRLFIATLAAVIVVFPLSMILMNNQIFVETIEKQFNALSEVFFNNKDSSFENEVIKSYLGGQNFTDYIKNFYTRSAAAMYFVLLLAVTRLSDMFLAQRGKIKLVKLENFKMPEIFLWPALLTAVFMIVEVFDLFSLGKFTAIVWNIGLILMFLYGIQGLAIARVLLDRFKLPPSIRFMFHFMIVMLLFAPGANYIVIIGLPVLGISETWINLRKTIRSTNREDHT